MLGRVEDYLAALARAHDAYLERDDELRAAGCALWIGLTLSTRGNVGRAGGWLGRAERLIERHGGDRVETAYLLVPRMFERAASGDLAGAIDTAAEIATAARRFGDADLLALATHEQGRFLVSDGRYDEGLRLFDEAMVTVTAGETSPIPTGIVYCGVIGGCQNAYELRRAAEWTSALSQWCERQPDMVAFSGTCLVHRAEVLQLRGAWSEAMEEVGRGYERCVGASNLSAAAEAAYRRAELHRVRGELDEAEADYRLASRDGREPQPGLALLWLAREDAEAAATTLRRVLGEATEPAARARVLPAVVEAMLAVGDVAAATAASRELAAEAATHGSELLAATARSSAGEVALAAGDAEAALADLRRAAAGWQTLDVPYEGARVRVLIGRACRMLGDEQSARLELEAARDTFARLGARPDTLRVDVLLGDAAEDSHGLTARELEVLRLVAGGATNKAIATELVLSERTVDRHVSNILAKLRVPSRAAATAFAYEHRLIQPRG
jgi:ATP/maltotriose-dependent transcriptional regulator MalT